MALSESSPNAFARGLAGAFSTVARGKDRTSSRFVAVRPSERILAGYLTPAGRDDSHAGDEWDGEDPDDAYQLQSIGFEWAAPKSCLDSGVQLAVRIELSCFLRVAPSFEEAKGNARFDKQGAGRLAEVWQRVALSSLDGAAISKTFSLSELKAARAITVSLQPELGGLVDGLDLRGLRALSVRREVPLHPGDIASESAYEGFLQSVLSGQGRLPQAWRPLLDLRAFPSPTEPGCVRLLLRLVNGSHQITKAQEAFWDPRLYAVACELSLPKDAQADSEFRILPSSYRYNRRLSVAGINCHARVVASENCLLVTSDAVPVVETPRLVPREILDGEPQFAILRDATTCADLLTRILAAMKRYDAEVWRVKVEELAAKEDKQEASSDREGFRRELEAFAEGIELLKDGESPAAKAFYLMNETMLRIGRGRKVPFSKWHLFQIVFIVAQLPGLVRQAGGKPIGENHLSLLWFPAGGGKTEAFLGLVLWHSFFDRLRQKRIGVTAFLRYPLRLLTFQQLQRIARALAMAEEVRLESRIEGEAFSLGYFVGQTTTPNDISDKLHAALQASPVPDSWRRIINCPHCRARTVKVRYNASERLIEHFCSSNVCPTQGRRLPIYVVDRDVYRFLPTVIVSTVDKLAGLGQNRRFAQLMGRVDLYCPTHGAAFGRSNREVCEASREAGTQPTSCGGRPVVRPPFHAIAPSLHIQDELHLLREALATFDSHYETAVLAMQRSVGRSHSWALIGATATIEGFVEQARHLYLGSASRFPGPGPEAYESFYYHRDTDLLGRAYVGVLGVERTHTPSVARTLSILYDLIEQIRKGAVAALDDTRALLGMPGASAEQLVELAFRYEIILTYVLTRKGADQVGEAVEDRVRADIERVSEAELRIESFNSGVDMPKMIDTMEEIEEARPETPLKDRVRGVIATNIISHGVDVDRFNIIVFAGLPRQMAEYIQASARVGRQIPGLSFLVVTPQGERDRSVLDRFEKFHEYVDRLVESVPANRWSERALQLTMPGILAGYLMGVAAALMGTEIYLVGHVRRAFGQPGAEALNESSVVEWIADALGADGENAPEGYAGAVRTLAARLYGKVAGASADHDAIPLGSHLDAMKSLRDVDDPAWIRLGAQDSETLAKLGI